MMESDSLRLRAILPGRSLLALALLAVLTSCVPDAGPSADLPSPGNPILLIGADGLEWSVVLPMIREGRLPVLAGLMERGAYGRLETMDPTISPVIWTTVATGKGPEKHGIRHFIKNKDGEDGPKLYTNQDRTTKALWNIFSDYGRRVYSIGWWMTFPAERVEGAMVAQTNTAAQIDTKGGRAVWKGGILPGLEGQVWPVSFQEEVMETASKVEDALPDLAREIFGKFPHPHSELNSRLWGNTLWALRADTIYRRIAGRILDRGEPWDLMLVYFGGTDVVGHRFWRYMEPGVYRTPPAPEEIENYGGVIRDYYAWLDGAIGDLVQRAGPDATILVLSDHGMHATNLKGAFDPDNPPENTNSGGHPDAPPGVLVAAGKGIRPAGLDAAAIAALAPGDLPLIGTMFDVTPSVLVLAGLPSGRDMDGEVLEDLMDPAFLAEHPPARVGSHDTDAWLKERPNQLLTPEAEEERLEQLRSLGYIE